MSMFDLLKEEIEELNYEELEAISLRETTSVAEALCELATSGLEHSESPTSISADLNPKSNTVSDMTSEFVSKFGIWSNDAGSDRNYLKSFSEDQLQNLNPDSSSDYSGSLSEGSLVNQLTNF